MGNHHLEYGFPSTHSTNSISIALLFFGHFHRLASTPAVSKNTLLSHTIPQPATTLQPIISAQTYTFLMIVLAIYTFSIVFGRLYTAMHSFTDCIVGVAMGAAIWWFHSSWSGIPISLTSSNPLHWLYSALWPSSLSDGGTHIIYIGKGLGAGEWMEGWVRRGGWEVPLILIVVCMLAINQHPQPVDDCPCFEDAIAFVSVVLGSLVGTWAMAYSGVDPVGRSVTTPGSSLAYTLEELVQPERTWAEVGVWWSVGVLKMVIGK
jgi:dihydrosphingosine 1-phosphate phosphatase